MKITEYKWNFFQIPIPKKKEETDIMYLVRVQEYLDKFYETHTTFKEPTRSQYKKYFGGPNSLPEEHNFCGMSLEGIVYCDVKYRVSTSPRGELVEGIEIWSHSDRPEWRKPMVDFLKEKWKAFNYQK